MLDINDLKRGSLIVLEKDPYIVLSAKHSHIGRGGASLQAKMKNLRTGKVLDKGFKSADTFEEANIERLDSVFIYERNGEYWFHEKADKSKRFSLKSEAMGEQAKFLKTNIEVKAFLFKDQFINIELPIKVDYKVMEAPPNIRGNTSSGGDKVVTLEGGAKVTVPLFIEEGDMVRINTDTGEYSERV